jgi:hypothetical protein
MLLSMVVCIVLLAVIGYAALLFGMEVLLWFVSRLFGSGRRANGMIVPNNAQTAMR